MSGGLQMWRIDRVTAETGLCRADIYRRMKDTDPARNPLPRNYPYRSGGKARFWRSDELNAWKMRECEPTPAAADPAAADPAAAAAEPAAGDARSLLELGIACSIASNGVAVDLVEAHKWFNLAALNGSSEAQEFRADVAEEMTAREIAEAQRRARAWLSDVATGRRARGSAGAGRTHRLTS